MYRIGPTRLKVLALVLDGMRRGRPYSVREMAARCGGLHNNAVVEHLRALIKHGLVCREAGQRRAWTPGVRFIPADRLEAPCE